jgi:two-component system chemotaxis sensor kinase CheA
MEITFDITDDELPIFVAEASEQLQMLDEGLVRLEREESDPDLLQALFRAAHTLKGAAGMINHKRMVDLTHAMETALDSLRKNQIVVSVALIDTCLEAIDALRELVDEVSCRQMSNVSIEPLVEQFNNLSKSPPPAQVEKAPVPAVKSEQKVDESSSSVFVFAEISPGSIASAARAFQLMLALQDLGQILHMEPEQSVIETAAPVQFFKAQIIPSRSIEEIRLSLSEIADVENLVVSRSEPAGSAAAEEEAAPIIIEGPSARLGEILIQNGLITPEQLQAALGRQRDTQPPVSLLGHNLVNLGFISQDVLDQVLADQLQPEKAAPARPAEPGVPEKPGAKARITVSEKTVRTSVERLDTLMNLVGELITDRNRLYSLRSELESRYRGEEQVEVLSETITHVGRITDQLQAEVMSIRMLPISNVFNKFPRLVRDLSRKADKQVDLVMRGEDTELDRSVIEEISDPLIHLLRNAVDHGLETPAERMAAGKHERGTILLTARHEQGRIILTVEDDGRGIDLESVKSKAVAKGLISEKEASVMTHEEAIELIFVAGLSTARAISDISGRGVGMDIVRNNIERLNGNIVVETWTGKGSQFQIVLPLTLAIMPTLLVRVRHDTFAIPLVTVTETLRIPRSSIQSINSRPVIQLRDHVLPVTRLTDVFDMGSHRNGNRQEYIVVVRSGKTQMGLIVDTLIGEQEVVVKSLSSIVGEVVGVSGAAILGDGQVALIVDVQGLFKLAVGTMTRFDPRSES